MNDLMSGGIHRAWKDCFMSRLRPTPNTKLLDVAGGTGQVMVHQVMVLFMVLSSNLISRKANLGNFLSF